MGNRINTIMQAAFFKLADVIPYEQADEYMKAYAKKTYGKKGDAIVQKNWDAIDIAISGLVKVDVPAECIPMKSTTFPNGIDALLSTVQMPSGMPVATVAIDGSASWRYPSWAAR